MSTAHAVASRWRSTTSTISPPNTARASPPFARSSSRRAVASPPMASRANHARPCVVSPPACLPSLPVTTSTALHPISKTSSTSDCSTTDQPTPTETTTMNIYHDTNAAGGWNDVEAVARRICTELWRATGAFPKITNYFADVVIDYEIVKREIAKLEPGEH